MHNANILILILSAGLWASCPATASPLPEPAPGLTPGDSRSTPPGGEQARPEASAKYLFMRAHIDFIAKSKRFTPLIEASLASMPGARVEDEAGEFDLRHGKLDALIPAPLSRARLDRAAGRGALLDGRPVRRPLIPILTFLRRDRWRRIRRVTT